MKKILITGVNSFIGNGVEHYLLEYNDQNGGQLYQVEKISQRDDEWEKNDFSIYDVVLDVTGIAHADIGRLSREQKQEYLKINCELVVKTAQKAKQQGVKQFVYLSSISVYGNDFRAGKTIYITKDTQPNPTNVYGRSKWEAEQQLMPLQSEDFQVAILRLPMVYGANCKGNYCLLSRMAGRFPVFPNATEGKSMIYIENLAEFIRLLVEQGGGGLFYPQNAEYASASELVRLIRKVRGKRTLICKGMGPVIKLVAGLPGKPGLLINKAFGGLAYSEEMSRQLGEYRLYDLEQSIWRTERNDKL